MLMDNVLPLASRRCPDNIDAFLESSDVQRLFGYYSDALEGVFTFYATSDKRSAHALLTQAVKLGHVAGPFAASQALTVAGRSPARATRSANTMKEVRRWRGGRRGARARDLFISPPLCSLVLSPRPSATPSSSSSRPTLTCPTA